MLSIFIFFHKKMKYFFIKHTIRIKLCQNFSQYILFLYSQFDQLI